MTRCLAPEARALRLVERMTAPAKAPPGQTGNAPGTAKQEGDHE